MTTAYELVVWRRNSKHLHAQWLADYLEGSTDSTCCSGTALAGEPEPHGPDACPDCERMAESLRRSDAATRYTGAVERDVRAQAERRRAIVALAKRLPVTTEWVREKWGVQATTARRILSRTAKAGHLRRIAPGQYVAVGP